MMDEKHILTVLEKCWSPESSSIWSKDNPAKGQCGVTSLVINKIFGGEILKTKLPNGSFHSYNFVNGIRYDFTHEQFSSNIEYLDIKSNRGEAFGDANESQYLYLLNKFEREYL